MFLHKTCFYTSPAFKQALLLHKSVFTQALLLHKPCFYTSAVFTQALPLHKTCFYTKAVFTQALSLHKHCLYTRPAFTQKRFYTRPPFTQTLSLHKLCLYTSIAFIQALLLHNDILLTKAFCNLQTGNRLEGRRNAEGCKYELNMKYSLKTTVKTVASNGGKKSSFCLTNGLIMFGQMAVLNSFLESKYMNCTWMILNEAVTHHSSKGSFLLGFLLGRWIKGSTWQLGVHRWPGRNRWNIMFTWFK